ncbi:MAG: pyridoxal-phosphate dependent enzyme [Mycobacterium sp.]
MLLGTPLFRCEALQPDLGSAVSIKLETVNPVGSFKARDAEAAASRPAAAFTSALYLRPVGFPRDGCCGMTPSSFPRSGASTQPISIHGFEIRECGYALWVAEQAATASRSQELAEGV